MCEPLVGSLCCDAPPRLYHGLFPFIAFIPSAHLGTGMSFSMLNNDVLLELCYHLDAISICRFLSLSKRFWLLTQKNSIIDRINPYKYDITMKRWNSGLLTSTLKSNVPQINYFIEKGADAMNKAMCEAAKMGNRTLVDLFILHGACRWSDGLESASLGGHKDLVDLFIEKGARNFQDAYLEAVKGGHRHLFEILSNRIPPLKGNSALIAACVGGQKDLVEEWFGPTQSINAMKTAARYGHKHIIDFLIENGVQDWKDGFVGAAYSGDKTLVEFFMKKFQCDSKTLSDALDAAAEGGHKHIVELLIDKGAQPMRLHLKLAATNGNKELVELFVSKGVQGWNEAMNSAAKGGHRDLVDYFIEKGAKNMNHGLNGAVTGGHSDLVDYFISRGADDWSAVVSAVIRGYPKILQLLLQKGKDEFDWNMLLRVASGEGDLNLVKFFLSKGAKKSPSVFVTQQDIIDYLDSK